MANNSRNEIFKVKEPKWQKLLSRPKWILSSFVKESKEYGLGVGLTGFLWWIGVYSRYPQIAAKALSMSTKQIDKYLQKHYQDILVHYTCLTETQTGEILPIKEYSFWCFWWQGEDHMPDVVRHCYHRIKKNNNNVVLITKENVREYVQFPKEIYDKVENGIISYTHFSDILRLTLLANFGGMWIDVTCFNPYTIPEYVKQMPFCSPHDKNKQQNQKLVAYWCDLGGWRSWNIGTNIKNSLLFTFARDMLQAIAIRQNCMPSYFMVDCMLSYAYRHFGKIKEMIDSMPDTNTRCADLFLYCFNTNKVWNEEEYLQLIEKDWLFKLTYKTVWKETVDGKPTFYGKLFS